MNEFTIKAHLFFKYNEKSFLPVTNSPLSTDTSFSSLAINVYKTIYRPLGSFAKIWKSGSEFKLACECFNELCRPIKPETLSSQLSIGITPSSISAVVPKDWSLGSFFLIAMSASCVLTGAQYEWGMNPFRTIRLLFYTAIVEEIDLTLPSCRESCPIT